MKSLFKLIILYLLLVSSISSCEKKQNVIEIEMNDDNPIQEEEIDSNTMEENIIVETYLGGTYVLWQMSNSTEGLSIKDTTYLDTCFVSLINQDSIQFSYWNSEVLFEINSEHSYIDYHSTHSHTTYELKNQDSLSISYWVWGGGGGNFNQENRDFNGVKQ